MSAWAKINKLLTRRKTLEKVGLATARQWILVIRSQYCADS